MACSMRHTQRLLQGPRYQCHEPCVQTHLVVDNEKYGVVPRKLFKMRTLYMRDFHNSFPYREVKNGVYITLAL